MTLLAYVRQQIAARIDAVAEQSAKADTSADGIHDLRVTIRRLNESLRVFEDLFPRGSARLVRKDLKLVMGVAGEVRNHDIARDLMRKARLPRSAEIAEGRQAAAAKLAARLESWNSGVPFKAWKEQLRAQAS
jgi:CHAD domain-containing protein